MGRFQFEVATPADDAELRSILAATPMDGRISVSFRREPSFFDAATVEGDFHQVVVCRDKRAGRIAGFGCRSVRTLFVNGQPISIGYLSALRALPEYRNRGLVARAYAFLRQLHADGRASLYLTTIAAGNKPAIATLTSGRAGLPTYRRIGTYHTMVLPIGARRFRTRSTAGVEVRSAVADDRADILQFLKTAGPARQFFPCYDESDFFERHGTFRELAPENILLAFRSGQLVGTLGGWNQSGFKQLVVEGYAASLRWTRPLYNTWARLRHLPLLPSPGQPLRYLTGIIPVVLDDDPDVILALLESLRRRLHASAAADSCPLMLVGLSESDPLLPLVQWLKLVSYVTGIYLVYWEEDESLLSQIDDRPAYLELGCL